MRRTGIGSEYWFGRPGGCYVTLRPSPREAFHATTLVPSGRSAIAVAAGYVMRTAAGRKQFLLPSYLCHTVIQPFLELGAEIGFYNVGRDLSVCGESIAGQIDARTAGVLLTTYFGFPRARDLAGILRAAHPDVQIIDDRTHNLLSDLAGADGGSVPAIRVYSARKWGPFPDLGLVCWPESPVAAPERLDKAWDGRFAGARVAALLLRTAFAVLPCEGLRRTSLGWVRRAEDILDRRIVSRNASPLSAFLWRFWDWQRVWARRRDNFAHLLRHWPENAGTPLHRCLPDGVGPLGFAIRTPDRDRLREQLRSRSVFAPVHWNLPRQVSEERFPESAILSREELTLPIDQRYERDDMDRILEAVHA